MNNEKQVDSSKRNLLKGMATATVAATVAGAAPQVSASSEVKPDDTKKVTGSRETQHVRDYYDTL